MGPKLKRFCFRCRSGAAPTLADICDEGWWPDGGLRKAELAQITRSSLFDVRWPQGGKLGTLSGAVSVRPRARVVFLFIKILPNCLLILLVGLGVCDPGGVNQRFRLPSPSTSSSNHHSPFLSSPISSHHRTLTSFLPFSSSHGERSNGTSFLDLTPPQTQDKSFKFDCDALYIETHSLHQEGKYQWALIYIDPQGAVTRLPTLTPKSPSRPTSRHSGSTQRESPAVPAQSNTISNPRGGSQLLGYCKIGGYTGGLNRSELEQVGNAALGGKEGVRPTWLLQVLATLQERGRVLWDGPVAGIEGRVLEINREADIRWLQAFLHSTPYRVYVTTI